MFISLYTNLLVMTIVASGLYLILKLMSRITLKHFSANWHYRTYLFAYSFFTIPYYYVLIFANKGLSHRITGVFEKVSASRTFSSIQSVSISEIAANRTLSQFLDIAVQTIPYLFIAGTIAFCILVVTQNYHLHAQLLKQCVKSHDTQALDILYQCELELKLKRHLAIYIYPDRVSPFLYGLLKPKIILPDVDFNDQELRHIFLHELTHRARRDTWVKSLILLVNAVHWFNPLAYMLKNDIDHFCEISCDEKITKTMDKQERGQYCELILGVLSNVTGSKLVSAFSTNRKYLERRIDMIINNSIPKKKLYICFIAAAVTLGLGVGGTFTAYAAYSNKPDVSSQTVVSKQSKSAAAATGEPAIVQPPYADEKDLITLLTYDSDTHVYRYEGKWVRTIDDRYTWDGKPFGGVSIMDPSQNASWGEPVDLKVVRNSETNKVERLIVMTESERQGAVSSFQ